MANKTSTLTVRLIDAVAAPARSAANAIRGIGTAVDQTNARRLNIAGTLQTTVRDVGRATDRMKKNFHGMTSGLSMPAGFLTFFGGRAVYEFEKMSNKLQAVTRMTDEQKKSIRNLALELSEFYPRTNDEIMGAAYELARAGFKYDQIVGGLKDTLNLSLAGDIGLQESADIATNILTAMRLPIKTAEETANSLRRVNDVLAYVASESNTDVRLMGETLKYIAPMAAAAGISIEELGGASMVLAQGGIRGSEAGVALRSALVRMVKPSLDARQAMAELGMSFEDFATSFRALDLSEMQSGFKNIGFDISKAIPNIQKNISGLSLENDRGKVYETILSTIINDLGITKQTDQNKITKALSRYISSHINELNMTGLFEALIDKGVSPGYMARIFDQRQGVRLTNLLREEGGVADITKGVEAVKKNAAGEADRMAKDMMQGIVGDWEALRANVSRLFVAIAESGVLKAVSDAIKSLSDGILRLSEVSPKILKFSSLALMLTVALAPIGLVLGGVVSSLMLFVNSIRLAGAVIAGAYGVIRAAMGLGAAGTAAGAAAGAGGAAAAGAGVAGKAAGRFGWLRGLGRFATRMGT